MTPTSLSLTSSSSTSATLLPASLCGGSSTLSTARLGAVLTPSSSGLTCFNGFFLAFCRGTDAELERWLPSPASQARHQTHHDIGQGGISRLIESEVSSHHGWEGHLDALQTTIYLPGDIETSLPTLQSRNEGGLGGGGGRGDGDFLW